MTPYTLFCSEMRKPGRSGISRVGGSKASIRTANSFRSPLTALFGLPGHHSGKIPKSTPPNKKTHHLKRRVNYYYFGTYLPNVQRLRLLFVVLLPILTILLGMILIFQIGCHTWLAGPFVPSSDRESFPSPLESALA